MIAIHNNLKTGQRRLRDLIYGLLFLSAILLLTSGRVYAVEDKEPIIVNGDKVEYLYEQKKVVGVNNVLITYKSVVLTCDRIEVDMATKDAIAEGNVLLKQKGGIMRGEKVTYNFQTQIGTIIKAEIRREPWYSKGDVASKVSSDEYRIKEGYLTTCDLPEPHYRIQARRVKIFIDDRVEAAHAFIFIGKVPILYLPYYIHPFEDKRPRVTIVPGRNSAWGFYVLTAWRYYLHEWSRGYIHLDWREKKGFAEGIDYKYRFGYFGKGLARFYYTKEDHLASAEEEATGQSIGDDRWRIQLRHKWKPDSDTNAFGEFHKLSDKLFAKDYFFLDEYETESQPPTYLSLIRTRPGYNLSLYLRARMHDFFTVVEKLPELKMEINSQRLKGTDFYYSSTTSFAMLQKKYEDTAYEPKLKANRLDTDHKFSYPANLFKFLSFNPYIKLRETWYSEDAMENKNELRTVFTSGLDLSAKFYRLFDFQTDAMGLDINDLRHVVTPSIDYAYTPVPSIKSEELKQFDEVDSVDSQNRMGMSIVHRLQTKRGINKEIVNLARLTTSSGILIKTVNNKVLDDLKLDLELTPYPWLRLDFDSSYNPKRTSVETINLDVVAEKIDFWRLGFGYRYEEGRIDESNSQITWDASYRLSPKWSLKAYHRYKKDLDKSNFVLEDQNYAVQRDLHCWLAEMNYEIKETDALKGELEHRIWLVMRMKAFPDLPIRMFSAKYSDPQAGIKTARSE